MDNPWTELPAKPPYVLAADAKVINGRPDIRLDLLPMPYTGNPDRAALYLLALNPGLSSMEEELLRNPYFVDQKRRGLTFESRYPFWQFDPALVSLPGQVYWAQRLGHLGAVLGEEFLREHVMCVEFFPYHSWKWTGLPKLVPSQGFSFDLVRRAIVDRKPIVLMRGRKQWLANVPELAPSGYFEPKTPRNSTISPKNMREGAFEQLINACRVALNGVE